MNLKFITKLVMAVALIATSLTPSASFAQCNPDALSEQIESARASYDDLNDQYAALLTERAEISQEITTLESSLLKEKKRLALYKQRLNSYKARLHKAQAKLSYLRSIEETECTDESSAECVAIRAQIASLLTQIEDYKDQVDTTQTLIASTQAEVTRLSTELNAANKDAIRNLNEIRSTQTKIRAVKRSIKVLTYSLAKCCNAGGDYDGDGHTSMACGGDDCDDQDATVYPGAPELCGDNIDNDCDGEVDETDLSVDAGSCVTVYYGYGPAEEATLTATASGGSGSYSYSWSNGATTASITVSPSSTTTYTVTVTDGSGCEATASVKVGVIDVRCGKKDDKVLVCHSAGKSGKSKDLCISANAVADHLAHGDMLGGCDQTDPCGDATGTILPSGEEELHTEHTGYGNDRVDETLEGLTSNKVNIYPNPSSNEVTVEVMSEIGVTNIQLTDIQGRVISSKVPVSGTTVFDVTESTNGIYFIVVQSNEKQITKRIMVVH